jgi:hypothetical protein
MRLVSVGHKERLNKLIFGQRETSETLAASAASAVLSRICCNLFFLACLTIAGLPVLANASVTTTTTLTGDANAVTGDVRLGAAIEACPPAGAPNISGTVQFFDGSTLVTGSLQFLTPPPTTGHCGGGPYTSQITILTLSAVSPGTHTYTAVYSGDTVYAPSTSAATTVTVPARPALVATTNTLTASANAVTGDVSLGAAIEACPPAGAPNISGTVQFFDGSTPVTGSLQILTPPPTTGHCGGGPYTSRITLLTLSAVSSGTHTYTAVYSGDTVYAPSAAGGSIVNVTALPPVPPGQSYSGPTAAQTGNATLQLSGGGPLCGFTRAAFFPVIGDSQSPPPNSQPPGVTFPHGLFGFVTSGCTLGATQTFTLTLPPGSQTTAEYWKYGPTPDNSAPHWYQIPITVHGNVVTFSIVDGGLGDDDLTANGTIVDAGGPVLVVISSPIPALSDWMLRAMVLLTACIGVMALGWRRQADRILISRNSFAAPSGLRALRNRWKR